MKNKLIKLFMMFVFANLASSTLEFMISWTVLRQSHQASQFALISMVSLISLLISMPFIGILVDRFEHKRLLIIAQVFSMFSLFCFAVQPFQNLPAYVIITFALNLGQILFLITMYSSVKNISENTEEMMKINSLEQGVSAVFSIISPAVAGFLMTLISIKTFVWIELFCEFLVLLLVLQLQFRKVEKDTENVKMEKEEKPKFSSVLKFFHHKKMIFCLIAMMILVNFSLTSVSVGIPFFITRHFNNTKILGFVQMGLPLGTIVASLFVHRIAQKYFLKLMTVSYLIQVASIFVFGFVTGMNLKSVALGVGSLLIAEIIIGIGLGFSRAPTTTFFQNNIPEGIQGRAFTLIDTTAQICSPLGMMIYGILFDHFMTFSIFAVTGILSLFFILLGVHLLRKSDYSEYIF